MRKRRTRSSGPWPTTCTGFRCGCCGTPRTQRMRRRRSSSRCSPIFRRSGTRACCGPGCSASRKRLQRAREQIQTFMRSNCGLVERACRCRCDRRAGVALRTRRVDPRKLLFTRSDLLQGVREMEHLHDEAAQVFREQRLRPVRAELVDRVKAIVHGTRSEEHTSELQSQSNLVCRLLLEKKKNKQNS